MLHPRKKSKKAIAMTFFIVIIMIFSCFTTACQPTPDEAAIVNKYDNSLEDAIAATPLPESDQFPGAQDNDLTENNTDVLEHWTDTISTEMLTINIDADITKPSVSTYPVFQVAPLVLDETFAKNIVDVLSQDAIKVYNESYWTKENYENAILRVQKDIADIKNGIMPPGDNRTPEEQLKELNNMLELYQEEYLALSDGADPSSLPLNYTFKEDSTRPEVKDTLNVAIEMESGNTLKGSFDRCEFSGLSFSIIQFYLDKEIIKGSPLLGEEASAIATSLIDKLDIGDFRLVQQYISNNNNMLVFTKAFNGIPLNNVITSTLFSNGVSDSEEYNMVVEQEMIIIGVNDTGVTSLFWTFPYTLETENDNVSLLSIDDVKDLFKQYVLYNAKGYSSEEKRTITINEINLGYMIIPQKDDLSTFRAIPVWDFIEVKKQAEYPEELAGNQETATTDQASNYISHSTINAIDGSIISRELGY